MRYFPEAIGVCVKKPKHRVLALQVAAMLAIFHFGFASFAWSLVLWSTLIMLRHSKDHIIVSSFLPMLVPIALFWFYTFICWQAPKNLKKAARLFVVATACSFALLIYDVRHDNYQMSGEDLQGGPRFYEYLTWPTYSALDYEYRKRFTH